MTSKSPTHSPYKITPDSPDVPHILALVRQTFAFMDTRIDPPSSMHRLTENAIRNHCRTGEIWAKGSPPFACIFLTPQAHALYLGKLAVRADQQGQGHARDLIDLACMRARSFGLAALELETRIELRENHTAFERMGFVKSGEGKHKGFDRPTFIVMRKDIEPH